MKIAILSDSPMLPTGYSNQMKQLTQYLHNKGHEIHYFANAYSGATLEHTKLEDGTDFNFKIYGDSENQYFANSLSPRLKEIKPDKFIILLDTFMLFPWFLNVDTSPAETYFWFPSDGGGGLPRGCEKILQKIDNPIAMSEFAQKQVKEYHNLSVTHIPHGLNVNRFYSLSINEKEEKRKQWGFQDKFVVGVVARNQLRKNLDKTIKTIALLKDKIPNLVLFMHCDPNDRANQTYSLTNLIQRYGLENRVVFSGMKPYEGFGWDKMNEVYNLMDCFFLSTSGEGFGIPLIEAMACQIPVVATNYTTTPEIVVNNNAGYGAKLAGTEDIDMFNQNMKDYDFKIVTGTMTGSWDVERGLIDCGHAAELIYKLSQNKELREKLGENGRKAVLEKYDFEKIGKQWEKLLKNENK